MYIYIHIIICNSIYRIYTHIHTNACLHGSLHGTPAAAHAYLDEHTQIRAYTSLCMTSKATLSHICVHTQSR